MPQFGDDVMELNLGPQHPSTHGVLRIKLRLDGEVIISAEPVIGYLHTGVEKECETRTYHQIFTLVDRLDYLQALLKSRLLQLVSKSSWGSRCLSGPKRSG